MFKQLLSIEFWRRVWTRIDEDEILGRAAQLSYYFLLAIFPLLIFIITLIGYVDAGLNVQQKLISYLADVMPPSAVQLLVTTLEEVIKGRGTLKLSFGLALALLAASSGINALAQALNAAYDVQETRPWWRVRLIAIGLTLALSLLIISALLIVLYGGQLGESLAGRFNRGSTFATIWNIIQWPIALGFVFLAFDMIYRFAPNVAAKRKGKGLPEDDFRLRWFSPGVGFAIALWLLVSLGFRFYLNFFDSYNATYGSLGAVIIMMLWFYLTGAAILFGGEINCELENRQ